CQKVSLDLLSLSKCERKMNYFMDAYNKETMRVGPSKTEKAPLLPHSPKQEFHFFPERFQVLKNRNTMLTEYVIPLDSLDF
ncbi:hypothetical protein DFH11DRAFT_1668995, partial [Phellopilus nigrolimitatus]